MNISYLCLECNEELNKSEFLGRLNGRYIVKCNNCNHIGSYKFGKITIRNSGLYVKRFRPNLKTIYSFREKLKELILLGFEREDLTKLFMTFLVNFEINKAEFLIINLGVLDFYRQVILYNYGEDSEFINMVNSMSDFFIMDGINYEQFD